MKFNPCGKEDLNPSSSGAIEKQIIIVVYDDTELIKRGVEGSNHHKVL